LSFKNEIHQVEFISFYKNRYKEDDKDDDFLDEENEVKKEKHQRQAIRQIEIEF